MEFKNTSVSNFEGAFRGMRNPMNSWDKSDSFFGIVNEYDVRGSKVAVLSRVSDDGYCEVADIGPEDMRVAKLLCNAGSSDRKFLRQINVCVDITAPLFWWKEASTYHIGVTTNSTSTMHKLASTPITIDCFEAGDMVDVILGDGISSEETFNALIDYMESLRKRYLETKDKSYWKELIRILPESWLQTRTMTLNYEVIRNICSQRRGHKLTEWKSFIEWAETLPYADELIFNKKD